MAKRRAAQLLRLRPDLKIVRSVGSFDALLQKVKSGKVDCAVVSAADVERLKKQEFVAELLTNQVCIPAPGQGAHERRDRFEQHFMRLLRAQAPHDAHGERCL